MGWTEEDAAAYAEWMALGKPGYGGGNIIAMPTREPPDPHDFPLRRRLERSTLTVENLKRQLQTEMNLRDNLIFELAQEAPLKLVAEWAGLSVGRVAMIVHAIDPTRDDLTEV